MYCSIILLGCISGLVFLYMDFVDIFYGELENERSFIMIYVISLICYIIAFCFYVSVPDIFRSAGEGWEVLFGLSIAAGCIALIAAIINQLCRWYAQADDFERVIETKKDKKTYEKEKFSLVEEFKLYLADMYPEHEKKIFEKIKPDNVTAYMIKYPEIKTNETLLALCNKIETLTNKVFNCDREVNTIERRIAVRKRTMWLTCLPILPKE
jgi:hypothetical protein